MALEEQGMSSFMRSGMYSLMGLFEIIPALQEIRLEKKYNEERTPERKQHSIRKSSQDMVNAIRWDYYGPTRIPSICSDSG